MILVKPPHPAGPHRTSTMRSPAASPRSMSGRHGISRLAMSRRSCPPNRGLTPKSPQSCGWVRATLAQRARPAGAVPESRDPHRLPRRVVGVSQHILTECAIMTQFGGENWVACPASVNAGIDPLPRAMLAATTGMSFQAGDQNARPKPSLIILPQIQFAMRTINGTIQQGPTPTRYLWSSSAPMLETSQCASG